MKNRTDYVFPNDWGLRGPAEKDRWYKQERNYRQAMRQDTVWGRRAREVHADNEHKVDETLD